MLVNLADRPITQGPCWDGGMPLCISQKLIKRFNSDESTTGDFLCVQQHWGFRFWLRICLIRHFSIEDLSIPCRNWAVHEILIVFISPLIAKVTTLGAPVILSHLIAI